MATLYTDPETIRLVTDLARKGHGRRAIALRMEIALSTVRKILDPGFAERERVRLAAVDKDRAPIRRQDPDYRAYQAEAGKSEAHKARSRLAAQRRRKGAGTDPTSWSDAAPTARAEHITAEEKARAEAARMRGVVNLSLEASMAANRLMRQRSCSWGQLIEDLLTEASQKNRP